MNNILDSTYRGIKIYKQPDLIGGWYYESPDLTTEAATVNFATTVNQMKQFIDDEFKHKDHQIFYKWDNVEIDNINLTNSNINNFGLYLVFENEIADIYKFKKDSHQNIINIKDEERYNKNTDYKGRNGVTWDEDELISWENYLIERL